MQPLSSRAKLRIGASPLTTAWLPLYVASEKGYYAKAGLDVEMVQYQGNTGTQLPILAKGDLDIAVMNPSPALFNQVAQGFDIRLLASNGIERKGRQTTAWLVVLKDKTKDIVDFKDLKGKTIELGVSGTPTEQMAIEALHLAGLTEQDANLSYQARSIPDIVARAKQGAADVFGATEPLATQSEADGTWVRWKSFVDIMPWYQPGLLAASSKLLKDSPAAASKFLEVHLSTVREMNATNGTWTPELVGIAAKIANIQPAVITAQGLVPYFDPNDAVSTDSLQRTQTLWVQKQLVKQAIDVNQLVDTSALSDALTRIGKQAA